MTEGKDVDVQPDRDNALGKSGGVHRNVAMLAGLSGLAAAAAVQGGAVEVRREREEAPAPASRYLSFTGQKGVKVIYALPPMWAEIRAAFPGADIATTIFAWGEDIYNPGKVEITPPLAAHERVHAIQQRGEPEAWWREYIAVPQFRLDQEIPAHIKEAWVLARGVGGPMRASIVKHIAWKLAHRLYHYPPGLMPLHKAETLIRKALAA